MKAFCNRKKMYIFLLMANLNQNQFDTDYHITKPAPQL